MAAGAVAGWQQDGSRMQAVLCTGHWAPELRRHGRGEREDQNRLLSRVPPVLTGNKCSPILTLLCINNLIFTMFGESDYLLSLSHTAFTHIHRI